MREPVFMHRDDYPATLQLLVAVVGGRQDAPALGFEPEELGAEVNWDRLTAPDALLSSTETAALLIAQGCAILEHHGGLPARLRGAVVAAVEAVAG